MKVQYGVNLLFCYFELGYSNKSRFILNTLKAVLIYSKFTSLKFFHSFFEILKMGTAQVGLKNYIDSYSKKCTMFQS